MLCALFFATILHTSIGNESMGVESEFGIDRGHSNCSNATPQIMYYYDRSVGDCFPFLYEGCGGGRNAYYTELRCRRYGKPADATYCIGKEKPVGNCRGRQDFTCPEGSYCKPRFWVPGICCDKKKREEWNKEFNPACEWNNVLMIESRSDPNKLRPLLGRDCSHKFCPEGSECVKGKHLAYCCGETNPPKGMYRVR
ncbi:hypothetical protein Y032_0143g2408 [Ancylostoma ceylanicum]|nr:hypothetical protein Y032_0143g2408 [Ancylostoma ceylanicum]